MDVVEGEKDFAANVDISDVAEEAADSDSRVVDSWSVGVLGIDDSEELGIREVEEAVVVDGSAGSRAVTFR